MRRRSALVAVSALALLAIGLPAGAEVDLIDRYHQLQASALVRLTEDGRTLPGDLVGSEVVVNAVGEVVDRLPFQARANDRVMAQSTAKVPCAHDTNRDGFTAYLPPAVYPIDKKNEKGSFLFHYYSQDNARKDQFKQPTVQFLMCGVGGVDAGGGSRITISGPGMTFNDPNAAHILGRNWKEGKTPEDYSINLGFEVPLKAVKVTGSIQQNPSNSLKGSVVPPYNGEMKEYHENAVNAWWEDGCRPRCTRFGGSNNYQGSVGEGLWEFPQSFKAQALDRGFLVVPYLEHFCANPVGC